MELQIKHLAPYLPYAIRFSTDFDHIRYVMAGLEIQKSIVVLKAYNNAKNKKRLAIKTMVKNNCKPILRPLSDLSKEIEHKGEKFVPIVEFLKMAHETWFKEKENTIYSEIEYSITPNQVKAYITFMATKDIVLYYLMPENFPVWIYNKLCEWHFDIFNLIGQGLATDINTLK